VPSYIEYFQQSLGKADVSSSISGAYKVGDVKKIGRLAGGVPPGLRGWL